MTGIAKKKFQRFGPIYRDPIPRFPVAARQRSLLTDNDLANINVIPPSGGEVEAEGDNYRFTFDGDLYTFNLRDMDGNAYQFVIVGAPGSEEIRLTLNPDPVVVGIVPNSSSQTYQFTTDNYFRIINVDTFIDWHTVSALLDESNLISDAFASNALNTTDANTFNSLFTAAYNPPIPSFYLRYISTGALYKPWIVLNGAYPMIQLTEQ